MKFKWLLFLFIPFSAFAQINPSLLPTFEDSLKPIAKEILYGKSDAQKDSANKLFISILNRALKTEGAFDYNFDSLISISKVKSNDNQVRILTWHLPLSDGSFKYFGFLQCVTKKKVETFFLNDKTATIKSPENANLDPNNWYGTIYYTIITSKYKKKTYYTLLGWKGNDKISTKKVIDNLYFENAKPRFGKPVFKYPKKTARRIVFEYSSEVSMSVKFYEDQKSIIFDHLSPTNSSLKGQYQFYSPDMSYDAFRFEKGEWIFMEDIDARNPKNPKDKIYNTPEKR